MGIKSCTNLRTNTNEGVQKALLESREEVRLPITLCEISDNIFLEVYGKGRDIGCITWGIKVRRATGEQHYHRVGSGNIKGGLYLADTIEPGLPILITEGEFDALIARQAGSGLIVSVAIGCVANKRINSRWFPKFITAPSMVEDALLMALKRRNMQPNSGLLQGPAVNTLVCPRIRSIDIKRTKAHAKELQPLHLL